MSAIRLMLLSLSLSSLALAQATVVTKEGTGEAAIVNKDEQKAFAEAQQNALRAAVEQAAGVKIDSDTLVVNNQLVRDQIFSNTSGYVKKFDLVSKKVEKGVVTVTVKADVITDNLEKDIEAARALVRRMGKPSIVILVHETTLQSTANGQAVTSSDHVATVLTEAFKADGWEVKDPAFAAGKVRIAAGASVGAVEAKEIGDLTKAAYILYGTAVLRNQDPPPEWMKDGKPLVFAVTGEYDLQLFSTENGRQLVKASGLLTHPGKPGAEFETMKKYVISYERSAHDVVKARKAEIIASVRNGVLEALRDQAVNGSQISLSVSGLDSFGAAKDFKKALEAIKGLREATQDGFNKGTAKYRIVFLGSAQELADQVEQASFKKKKLTIVSVSGNAMEVQVGGK
ncbi:MAG: flagellar assembly protein T N-terminal domain-containing protein [Myxococcota bacterium]